MLTFLFRVGIILGAVVLLTAGVFFANGGNTAVGLSDWLVNASFITLFVGAAAGLTLRGVSSLSLENAEDTPRQRYLRRFFQAGPFAAAFTTAAVACFVVAILVDVLFSSR